VKKEPIEMKSNREKPSQENQDKSETKTKRKGCGCGSARRKQGTTRRKLSR
jgi:hypothetical protein